MVKSRAVQKQEPRKKTEVLCIHRVRKYYCKKCPGKGICEHAKERRRCQACVDTGAVQKQEPRKKTEVLCIHRVKKYYCKKCPGKGICEHAKVRHFCKKCPGKGICEHGKEWRWCKACVDTGAVPKRRKITANKNGVSRTRISRITKFRPVSPAPSSVYSIASSTRSSRSSTPRSAAPQQKKRIQRIGAFRAVESSDSESSVYVFADTEDDDDDSESVAIGGGTAGARPRFSPARLHAGGGEASVSHTTSRLTRSNSGCPAHVQSTHISTPKRKQLIDADAQLTPAARRRRTS